MNISNPTQEPIMFSYFQDFQDAFKYLLFGVSTIEPDWLNRFERIANRKKDWAGECSRIIKEEYVKNANAQDGYARVGWFLLSRGEVERALKWFDRDGVPKHMSWWLQIRKAEALFQLGRQKEAEALVRITYAGHPAARNGFASIAWRMRLALTPEILLELVRRDEVESRLTSGFTGNYAFLLALSGNWGEAIRKVENGYANSIDLKNGFSNLAWIKAKDRDWTAARDLAGKDFIKGRISPSWQLFYAQMIYRCSDLESAIKLVEDAYRLDKGLLDGFAHIAWIAYEKDDFVESLKLFRRDHKERRLSEEWLANWQVVKSRLTGTCDDISLPCIIGLVEKEIKSVDLDDLSQINVFYRLFEKIKKLIQIERDESILVVFDLLEVICSQMVHMRLSSRHLLIAALHGLKPNRKWSLPNTYADTICWIKDCHARLNQSFSDWQAVEHCYPAFKENDKIVAARCSIEIAEQMLGRSCGLLGDCLAQYGAVVQLVNEGCKSLCIVELGTLFGGSCMLFLSASNKLFANARIICIDPMNGYYGNERDPTSGALVSPRTFWKNIERMKIPKQIVELRRCHSYQNEAMSGIDDDSIDILLIDADHSHEGVLKDWRNYHKRVRPGGIVIFDDYNSPEHPGVKVSVEEICSTFFGWSCLCCIGTSMVVRRELGTYS